MRSPHLFTSLHSEHNGFHRLKESVRLIPERDNETEPYVRKLSSRAAVHKSRAEENETYIAFAERLIRQNPLSCFFQENMNTRVRLHMQISIQISAAAISFPAARHIALQAIISAKGCGGRTGSSPGTPGIPRYCSV